VVLWTAVWVTFAAVVGPWIVLALPFVVPGVVRGLRGSLPPITAEADGEAVVALPRTAVPSALAAAGRGVVAVGGDAIGLELYSAAEDRVSRPLPVSVPCYFGRRDHPTAVVRIHAAPHGGEPRWIAMCEACARRRRWRHAPALFVNPPFPATDATDAVDAMNDTGAPLRPLVTFRGRGRNRIVIPAFGEARLAVLAVRTSFLNSFLGGAESGAEIILIRVGDQENDRKGNVLPRIAGSLRGRIVVPLDSVLEIRGLGRWEFDLWPADAAHGFADRISGSRGLDVFTYCGPPGRVAVSEGVLLEAQLWHRTPTYQRPQRIGFMDKPSLVPGDLIAVSATNDWSLHVVPAPTEI
jgi:hypothetical protein